MKGSDQVTSNRSHDLQQVICPSSRWTSQGSSQSETHITILDLIMHAVNVGNYIFHFQLWLGYFLTTTSRVFYNFIVQIMASVQRRKVPNLNFKNRKQFQLMSRICDAIRT